MQKFRFFKGWTLKLRKRNAGEYMDQASVEGQTNNIAPWKITGERAILNHVFFMYLTIDVVPKLLL